MKRKKDYRVPSFDEVRKSRENRSQDDTNVTDEELVGFGQIDEDQEDEQNSEERPKHKKRKKKVSLKKVVKVLKALGYPAAFIIGAIITGKIFRRKHRNTEELDTSDLKQYVNDDETVKVTTDDPVTMAAMEELGLKSQDVVF